MKKPRKIVKRNPMAAEIARNPLYRTKVMASADELAQKSDPWDRNAKHRLDDLTDGDDDDDV
jgi:hypothetical protein